MEEYYICNRQNSRHGIIIATGAKQIDEGVQVRVSVIIIQEGTKQWDQLLQAKAMDKQLWGQQRRDQPEEEQVTEAVDEDEQDKEEALCGVFEKEMNLESTPQGEQEAEVKKQVEIGQKPQPATEPPPKQSQLTTQLCTEPPTQPPPQLPSLPLAAPTFCPCSHSPSIALPSACLALQSAPYYLNSKLALTTPVSRPCSLTFRIQHLQYCIGFGLALKQIVASHDYTYKSQGEGQLGHGLYLVTTQGYSWSHSEQAEDDVRREGFVGGYQGCRVAVAVRGEELEFRRGMHGFVMRVPDWVWDSFTVCFCVYLHQKQDSASIAP